MFQRSNRRIGFFLALAVILFSATRPLSAQDRAGAPEDWLHFVPGDVRFYIEIEDLSGLRGHFLRLGIWHAIRDITEREGTTSTRPANRLPGLSADTAISELIGRRCALWASDSTRWQDGVLFAELDRPESAQRWRSLWRADRIPDDGAIQRYVLQGGMRMAIRDRLLVLGPANDPENLWGRAVDLIAGRSGSHLRGQSEFASLFGRMKAPFDGLAYVAWRAGDPFAIADCERMIVGFSVNEDELRCEAHGQRHGSREALFPIDSSVVDHLPANTIAAFSGSFTPKKLAAKSKSGIALEEESLLGMLVDMIGVNAGSLSDRVGPRVTVLAGLGRASGQRGEIAAPSIGLMIESKDSRRVADQLGAMMNLLAGAASLAASLGGESPAPVVVQERKSGDVEYQAVAIGVPLARRLSLPFLAELEPAWTAQPGCVMVASTPDELKSMIRARRGGERVLAEVESEASADSGGGATRETSEWAYVRGTEVSRMLRNWLGYIRNRHPEALQDSWWKSWALDRARARTRFGVGLRDESETPGVAVVAEMSATSPAAGLLEVGDRIVAVMDRPLPEIGAAAEVARRYQNRGALRQFDMTVIRQEKREVVRVAVEPLPTSELRALEPIRAMRHLIVLLGRVEMIRYERFGLLGDRLDVRILVKWQRTAAPRHP